MEITTYTKTNFPNPEQTDKCFKLRHGQNKYNIKSDKT